MNKIKALVLSTLTVFSLGLAVAPVAAPALVFADAQSQACEGLGGTQSEGTCKTGGTQVVDVIKFAINLLSVIVGVASVIMIIIGGFKYVTSSGDSNNIANAKNTIIYAIVGLIVAALAQVIARFVLVSL
jgi:hypothetical protein